MVLHQTTLARRLKLASRVGQTPATHHVGCRQDPVTVAIKLFHEETVIDALVANIRRTITYAGVEV